MPENLKLSVENRLILAFWDFLFKLHSCDPYVLKEKTFGI